MIIFYTKQFGFRSKHSTDHEILCIIDRIQKAIDNRSFSCGIFLDFSKAFDTVNHEILINKLENTLSICCWSNFHWQRLAAASLQIA